ncbi:MAG: hypothetical protein ACFFCS_26320, partial [Candidatus Hodarchaeota archaeon]
MTKSSKYILPIIFIISLYVLYFIVDSFSEPVSFEMIFFDVLFNVFMALFVFGMLVYGLLGIVFSRIYFPIHRFFTRSKDLEKHY